MNPIFLGHVFVFSLAAIACVGSIARAQKIPHADTRRGLTALLCTSGLWAGFHVGYLVAPAVPVKEAFYILGLISGLLTVGAWLYFTAAYTGRPPRQAPYRRLALGVLLVFVVLKLTNPLHHLYFTADLATTPFTHLAIQHGVLHWVALALAYSLAFIGFFMLVEHFHHSGVNTRPLAVLIGLTALPVGFNVLGVVTPWLLAVTYEPIGVAVFAIGVLFVYFDRFRTIHLAGDTDDPVIFVDKDDRIRDYNQTATDVFPALSDAIGEPLHELLPDFAEQVDETTGVVELSREGHTRYYRVTITPFMAGETQTGRSLVLSDVTEREQYQQQLERKTAQLEALNGVVRHDIRNDMTVILGWGETLKAHVDQEGMEAVDRILRKAEHVVEITDIARDVVESLAADTQIELESVDLETHLDAELETVEDTYSGVQIHAPETVPSVAVQANEMLSSVFRNILNNAVQHNDKETPEITVTVEEDEETVQVRFADNGPGLSDAEKESVFGKNAKGLTSDGTGIGLYLVQTLTTQFGGSVWIEDNEPTGAVFVVELRVAD